MESVIATREEIQDFLFIQLPIYNYSRYDSYDFGYGDEYGHGYGFGCGDGYSNNFSSGDGSGSGSGSGNSFSSSDGEGYGHGAGSGYIECYGYGYIGDYRFSVKDIKALNGNIVDYIDSLPTIIIQVRDNFAKGYIIKNDLTLSPCYIAKIGNFFAHGSTLKEAVADAKAKELEKISVEERIAKFVKIFGSLDSEHTGQEFYDWHHILTGSCRIGRDEFCKAHNIDLSKKYTVKYFLDITKDSFGGDVIKLIKKAYENIGE